MKSKVTIMITIASCIAAIAFILTGGSEQTKPPCTIIEDQMASGVLHNSYFRIYRDVKGYYPDNLDSFYDFLESSESGFSSDQVSYFKSQIVDPFTKKEYVYFPLKIEGKIVDYVLYSLGADKKDDNISSLRAYDRGEISKVVFLCFPIDCEKYPLNDSSKKADIIVRVPGITYGSQFEIEFLDLDKWG